MVACRAEFASGNCCRSLVHPRQIATTPLVFLQPISILADCGRGCYQGSTRSLTGTEARPRLECLQAENASVWADGFGGEGFSPNSLPDWLECLFRKSGLAVSFPLREAGKRAERKEPFC